MAEHRKQRKPWFGVAFGVTSLLAFAVATVLALVNDHYSTAGICWIVGVWWIWYINSELRLRKETPIHE